jgi:predicted membrane protein
MRRLFIILGFIAAILTVILAVTPLSKLAFLPAVAALVFGLIAFYISRKQNNPKKSIQIIFLLTIISLGITTYKAVFETTEVANVEELEVKESESIEDSKDILETLEIEDIDLEGLEEIELETEDIPTEESLGEPIEDVDLGDLEIE